MFNYWDGGGEIDLKDDSNSNGYALTISESGGFGFYKIENNSSSLLWGINPYPYKCHFSIADNRIYVERSDGKYAFATIDGHNQSLCTSVSVTPLKNGLMPTARTYRIAHAIIAGYISGSGNYLTFCLPFYMEPNGFGNATLSFDHSSSSSITVFANNTKYTDTDLDLSTQTSYKMPNIAAQIYMELKFNSTKTPNQSTTIYLTDVNVTFS